MIMGSRYLGFVVARKRGLEIGNSLFLIFNLSLQGLRISRIP
jgi:hypothetical protein